MNLDYLMLLSGIDIPFPQAQLIITVPKIKDIALIGEQEFWTGVQFLCYSVKDEKIEDKIDLSSFSNFEILMSISKDKNPTVQFNVTCATMVLALLFPNYTIKWMPPVGIILFQDGENHFINKENFENFREIIAEIFCLNQLKGKKGPEYNPGDSLRAKQLAKQFEEYHKKLAKLKGQDSENKNLSILGRYISILSVAEQKDMNLLLNYSVYQLFDEYRRYSLNEDFDIYLRAKLAGAQDLQEVEDWKQDLYIQDSNDN